MHEILLRWCELPDDDEQTAQSKRAASKLLPASRRLGCGSYSEALVKVGGLSNLYDGVIYRLLDVDLQDASRSLTFSIGRYFDYLDTGEVLAFEAVTKGRGIKSKLRRSYRRTLQDPFNFRNRVASLGIDTLTVRVGDGDAGFFLHQRDPKRVVNNSNQIGVIPAGEFTPSNVTKESVRADLSIWRNIMREYAEEFLGVEDAQGRGGTWIDYDKDPPYATLNRALKDGQLTIKVLGLGVDPVAWKPELLTVCIIASQCFDQVFGSMVGVNEEGLVLAGRRLAGLPFDAETIHQYVTAPDTSPNAKACLQLAWKHRVVLGLPG